MGSALCLAVLLMLTQNDALPNRTHDCGRDAQPPAAEVQFPLEFDVTSGNRLYLYGERIETVRLTSVPGDSLFLNGVPILPRGYREDPWYEPPSDEYLLRWIGDVPFVQELIAQGESPHVAGSRYFDERERVTWAFWKSYAELVVERNVPGAIDTALTRLPELDTHGLIDWERPPVAAGHSVKIHWKGIERSRWNTLIDTPEEVLNPPGPRMPSEASKASRAAQLHAALTSGRPCWCFIGLGGYSLRCGAEVVAEVESELDAVLESGDPDGVLHMSVHTAREILARQGATGGLPN